jgi:prephenate dehydrogenase
MGDFRIAKLVIIGVGLIGGSFALALRRAGAVGHVIGVGRSRPNLETALERRMIDEISFHVEDAVRGADLILLAMPVGQTAGMLAQLDRCVDAATVVTDAGSTKRDVVAAARTMFTRNLQRFVPAHPVAGAERTGAGAATGLLYQGRHVILTPLAETDPAALGLVARAWEKCGAKVSSMSPEEHDHALGMVSHFPHLLAFAYMDTLMADPSASRMLGYAGTGFRDFTRIAASSPEMWRDICLANREQLLAGLEAYGSTLNELRAALESGDGTALERLFVLANRVRRDWGARFEPSGDSAGE